MQIERKNLLIQIALRSLKESKNLIRHDVILALKPKANEAVCHDIGEVAA